jgi:hypothetical protein
MKLPLANNNAHVDEIFLCGDLNSRIGDMMDYIQGVDSLPNRIVIDPTKNNHGSAFIEFLQESKMCVCNGRVTDEHNNFTSISSRGRAVVDYIAVKHSGIVNCLKSQVLTPVQVVGMVNMEGALSSRCKIT